jgi:excinuclease ABC subunit C
MSGKPSDIPPEIDLPDDMDLAEAGDEGVEEGDSGVELDFEADATPLRLKAGVEVIQKALRTLPNVPGVYRMMIAETASMEFVTTETETEALLLEANYIKQLKPRFNVLLRDDKSFPYILIASDHIAPQLTKHRGARNRQGYYFGPFANVWAVSRTVTALQRAFLLRTCTDSFFQNRTRPCLLYQIKRCAGPCTNGVDAPGYARLVAEARDFLSGKSQAVKARLGEAMQEASDALEFEAAARLRDRLAALSAIASSQDINPQTVDEADVFALHEDAGQFCIQIFFFGITRIGGTALISRGRTVRFRRPRCWRSLWRSFTMTSRRQSWFCCRMSPRRANCSRMRCRFMPGIVSR